MLQKLLTLCVFTFGVLLPPGFAASLAVDPGGPGFTGTELADTGTLPFSTSSPNVSGTLDQRVYQEAGGTLDFYYLVTNSATSAQPVLRMTATNFTGFSLAVAFLSIPVGGIPPTEADRSIDGSTVGFDDFLIPGSSSAWLEISTSATAFALSGTTDIIDLSGDTVGSLTTYSPVAVPEPSSAILTLGLTALFLLLRRGRRQALFSRLHQSALSDDTASA